MSTAMPQVPPRPTRQDHHANSLPADLPKIPPRPANPRFQRSPSRERFASSPLNEPPSQSGINGKHSTLKKELESEPPRRPPSVTLPSLGQEGNEYGEILAALQNEEGTPKETRSVANDLQIHAPKPSLPKSSAEQRVSAVTRTDSGQAAAFGIGKASSEKSVTDDKEPAARSIRPKASFTSQHSNGGFDRPPSSLDGGEHGIPEIGQRVPMLPFAGDVQAPSPAPNSTPYAPGIGFHNDGSKPRHHGRRTSARGFEGPPGSYGLHGHGVVSHDRFEKAYYEKHPDIYKKECQYNEEKAEWALSSDDLNKVVRDTASRGVGIGTSPANYGTPTDEVGFQAAEEYASRISRPQSTRLSQVLTSEDQGTTDLEGALKQGLSGRSIHSESEEDGVIHVDEPGHRSSRIFEAEYGSTDNLAASGTPAPEEEELGYSAPILAADEVAKEPFSYELQPAVSPFQERKGSAFEGYNIRSSSASSVSGSRPTSRPASIHGVLPGFHESTPLEDLREYEPLFPEGDKKTTTQADKLKRPELRKQKFPSQDIWEDTPTSLQYTATVSTPQLPEDDDAKTVTEVEVHEGETQEQAFARKQEELAEAESHNPESFFRPEKKPWTAPAEEIAKIPRFPSRDIWEETPDSLRLETTVSSPQIDEKDTASPLEERLTAATAVSKDTPPALEPSHKEEHADTTTTTTHSKPSIPPRPSKAKPDATYHAAYPTAPERPSRLRQEQPADEVHPPVSTKPKPQIPARPTKLVKRDSAEEVPSKSVEPVTAPESKPKPTIPSRPVGGKIAALQNSFMADLNKRLQLGPQAPKKEEPAPEEKVEEKEKVPLADARKGRARGPARRAPTKAVTPAAAEPMTEKSGITLSLSIQSKVWEIVPEDNSLNVSSYEESSPSKPASKVSDNSTASVEPAAPEPLASSESKEPPSELTAQLTTEPEPTVAEPEATPLVENIAGEKLGDAASPEQDHASAVETRTHQQVEKDAAPLPHDEAPKVDGAQEIAPRDPKDTTAPSKADAEKVDGSPAN